MTAFNNFSNVLPDGVNSISTAGALGGSIMEITVQGVNALNGIGNPGTVTLDSTKYSQTSNNGIGAKFSITTDSSGEVTLASIVSSGRGYKVGDTFLLPSANLPKTTGTSIVLKVSRVANSGDAAPGFKTVSVTSTSPIMKSRTNSGKLLTRYASYHRFDFSVSYHKLQKSQFMPLYAFLIEKQGSLKPFFVEMPQYQGAGGNLSAASTSAAGSVSLTASLTSTDTSPAIGDLFTIDDDSNSNHTKSYMVTRIETYEEYRVTQPSLEEINIYFTPPLSSSISSGSTVVFDRPLVKVINKSDKQPYTIDQDNLYSIKLSLEEAAD